MLSVTGPRSKSSRTRSRLRFAKPRSIFFTVKASRARAICSIWVLRKAWSRRAVLVQLRRRTHRARSRKRPRVPSCESRHAQPPGCRSTSSARLDGHRRDRAHVRQDRIISAFEARPRSRKPVSSAFGNLHLKKTEENGDFVLLFSLLPSVHLV